MKLFQICKDGGPDSIVSGLFFIEIKRLFSVAILRFGNGSREAFHSHAFNSISWLLKGKLVEIGIGGGIEIWGAFRILGVYHPSFKPILTPRDRFHKVKSEGTSYVLTFRGPWRETWQEHLPTGETVTLTSGRKRIA